MLRKIIFLIFCIIFFTNYGRYCLSENDIYGNWYPFLDTTIKSEKMVYKEQCFVNNEYYFYESVLSLPYEYQIRKNNIYFFNFYGHKSVCLGSIVFIDTNTLKITYDNSNEYFILKRVMDNNSLDDFVNQRINEKTYYPSYLKRKEYWEKYGMLPEDGDFENPPKCSD